MNETRDYVITTDGMTKSFGEVHALQDVNLRVPRHSIFGFMGPNGAGKTTLIKILLGLSRPSAGSGTIFGHDIVSDSVAIRERVGYLAQQPRFIDQMTARENLAFTARFFFSGPEARIRERCDEMLELVGLTDKADRPTKGFSGGEKQRLGIALAQVNYPDLLILDEPASALDPVGRQAVLDIMSRLRKQTTVFYSTHILDDVQRVSDTVAILNRGRLSVSGPIERIMRGNDGLVYTLAVQGSPNGLGARLGALPWVTDATVVEKDGTSRWQVCVNDQAAAEATLLRYVLADSTATVTEFRRKQYDLDEVFMEIVGGASDGRQ